MLRDEPGVYACTAHVTRCHVDMAPHRMSATIACPACGRATCRAHLRACGWCGRRVCVRDIGPGGDRCATCERLTVVDEPPDHVLTAAAALLSERRAPTHWKLARDAEHTVVELDLGWTRHLVFTVRHGDAVVGGGRSHSIVGATPLRLASK
jgi:hypothetical protein